jgi:hypothetical protein
MEEEEDHRTTSSASSTLIPSTSPVQVVEEEGGAGADRQRHEHHDDSRNLRRRRGLSYHVRISISSTESAANVLDDLWPFILVLLTFWFFVASMTVILGFYGSENIPVTPYCSRLIQVNPLFVQSIKAQESDESLNGAVLYGFIKPPPLDIEIIWSESYHVVVQSADHKEWQYFLNKGSEVEISYNVKSPSSYAPLSIVIAQGKESLIEWIEYPAYPNTTLSWNLVIGNDKIEQVFSKSETYYIALASLNSDYVEVELNFTFKAFVYNASKGYYNCSLNYGECELNLFLSRSISAVIASPGSHQGLNNERFVKLSYGPRWIIYFLGSSIMTILMVLCFKICSKFQITPLVPPQTGAERDPLLRQRDADDMASWGSSYDSMSNDDEDFDKLLAAQEDKSNNIDGPKCPCVLCYDEPRDSFFLPCGHCAVCFACGTRVIEEGGNCPTCRKPMKKVRKIFTV